MNDLRNRSHSDNLMISQSQFNITLPRFNGLLALGLCFKTNSWQCESNYVAQAGPHVYLSTTLSYTAGFDHLKVAFTISYHENYLCPVCYLRLWKNGSIQFEKIEKASLESHHILGEPWLMIHPCEDEEAITQLLGRDYTPLDYFITWFGTRGLPSVIPEISFRLPNGLPLDKEM